MDLHGKNIIAGETSSQEATDAGFHAANPATGEQLEPKFHDATLEELEAAAFLGAHAAITFVKDRERRAVLLERIADGIEGLGDELVARVVAESGLPEGRVVMERGRTCNQLRMFAAVARDGSYLEARIDRAQPDRAPIPKPDLRRINVPLGPVAVFGASNFPLAFSVAGGDTASALAAGCPVVAKAHPAHPGTCEMIGRVICDAVAACDLPGGVFSLVHGVGHPVGATLVCLDEIEAVAFTGSFAGGSALLEQSLERGRLIPFYAEMGSVNPVVVLPGAAAERATDLAAGLQGSVCLGAGQFCTNPGVVFAVDDDATNGLIDQLTSLMTEAPDGTLVHSGIRQGYMAACAQLEAVDGVERAGRPADDAGPGEAAATPAVFTTSAATLRLNPEILDEVFGPATLVVRCESVDDITDFIVDIEGQLTTTIHGTDAELATEETANLVEALQTISGRVVVNGFPTGVEVCPSMHHGGPWPASTDIRATSVGTAAIARFVRPFSYQGFPASLLPPELHDGNPSGIRRLIDGEWSLE